jgi:hypothetical protein
MICEQQFNPWLSFLTGSDKNCENCHSFVILIESHQWLQEYVSLIGLGHVLFRAQCMRQQ